MMQNTLRTERNHVDSDIETIKHFDDHTLQFIEQNWLSNSHAVGSRSLELLK